MFTSLISNIAIIRSRNGPRYRVVDLLGQGTFGQVVKCVNLATKDVVAVKVVKNKPAYYKQGLVELKIVRKLNQEFDPEDTGHIVRLKDYFQYQNHLCLVFELLSINLYELIKLNQHRGFSMNLLRIFLEQIIEAQAVLSKAQCIHCDLKPENILLCDLSSPGIKVIDYGSACFENDTVFSYIQSRFYRSPEVILGVRYTGAIDVWSIGCIAAELFFGLPLFPGNSEFNQIRRIVEMMGMPPDWMLQQGKNSRKYFAVGQVMYGANARNFGPMYQIKTEERYAMETGTRVQSTKRYFTHSTLTENIVKFPMKSGLSPEAMQKENALRNCFAHFLSGLLKLDPMKRWTPEQAKQHPFITEQPFNGTWTPPQQRVTTLPQAIPIGHHLNRTSGSNIGTPDSFSFSPGKQFSFHLGKSPSTNFSSISPGYASHSSLPKDSPSNYGPVGMGGYYPPLGASPYGSSSMFIPTPPATYSTQSFQLGNTPTNSFYHKSQYASPETRTQNKEYRSQPAISRNSVPSFTSPQFNVFKTTSTGSQPPPKSSTVIPKKKHRKMPSAGQVNYSPDTFVKSPEKSPIRSSPESDGSEWEEQFYFENDASPTDQHSSTYSSPAIMEKPSSQQHQHSPYGPIGGFTPSSNTFNDGFKSFTQGALSYNESSSSSFLDPSIFPFRRNTDTHKKN